MGNTLHKLLCDFCQAPDPQWDYPCKTFVFQATQCSEEDWVACDTCHDIIERGDREVLSFRATKALLEAHPDMRPDMVYVLASVRELHDLFFANRLTIQNSEVN